MRMLRPSPGEVADRQTILSLKAKYGDLLRRNIKPFTDENNALQDYLEKTWFLKISPEVGEQYNNLWYALRETNSTLWKLEDEARVVRANRNDGTTVRLGEIYDQVVGLNDERANQVKEINKLFNVFDQEKVYIQS